MFNFRTDLADERRDLFRKINNMDNEIDGVKSEKKDLGDNIFISKVDILNEKGEESLGKKKGCYVTIDMKKLKTANEDEIEKASNILSNELKQMVQMKIQPQDEVLVVGLGNEYVTPDSLGPKVVSNIEITRHVIKYMPQYVKPGTRSISAVAPGVLGTTGIETLEILKGIVENVKPKLIVVIDALASRSIERISSTIQLSNTGIVPGSGVDNKRKELTEETLGVPVLAIGIPTVVETAVLVNDTLNLFIKKLQDEAKSNDYLNNLKNQDNYEEIKEALMPQDYNYIVTPKEIDDLIENMKEVVARGINYSL